MASLRLEKIRKVYPNGHVAVPGLDLAVADGEFLVLVGPSGCGKTTILRMIVGLEPITAGRLFLGEQDATRLPPQQRDLAMVFQNYALYPDKTVAENLAFPLRLRRTPRPVITERVHTVAASLDLTNLLARKPSQLSGGERQRVALGRAIVREPRAFLLDEPLSNLDTQLRYQMRTELVRLHRRLHATMIHVTHDQEEALTLGDRVAVLREGQLQQLGPPLDVYRRPANLFVAGFIGAPAMNFFSGRLRPGNTGLLFDTPGLALPLPDLPDEIAGREVVLGIRPPDVKLASSHEADVVARVEVIQPLGSVSLAHLRISGAPAESILTIVVSRESEPAEGDHVGVRFPRECLHLFEAGTGLRLATP